MGTSQSHPGSSGYSPLVPPWADDQPDIPLPPPEPTRFRPFRRALGQYVRDGNNADLRTALGHYSRTSTAGGRTASRRLGSVTRVGALLYGALSDGGDSGVASEPGIDLESFAGQPCDVAIDAITRALTTTDGDSDKIRSAMNHALVEALDGVEIFDPNSITDEIIAETMIGYLSESIFLQIVEDGSKAWTKAETPSRVAVAENALHELIRVVVDKHMAPKLLGNGRSFTSDQMRELQREVIQSVWKDWEAYS